MAVSMTLAISVLRIYEALVVQVYRTSVNWMVECYYKNVIWDLELHTYIPDFKYYVPGIWTDKWSAIRKNITSIWVTSTIFVHETS